jgi:hypothetical protein
VGYGVYRRGHCDVLSFAMHGRHMDYKVGNDDERAC